MKRDVWLWHSLFFFLTFIRNYSKKAQKQSITNLFVFFNQFNSYHFSFFLSLISNSPILFHFCIVPYVKLRGYLILTSICTSTLLKNLKKSNHITCNKIKTNSLVSSNIQFSLHFNFPDYLLAQLFESESNEGHALLIRHLKSFLVFNSLLLYTPPCLS